MEIFEKAKLWKITKPFNQIKLVNKAKIPTILVYENGSTVFPSFSILKISKTNQCSDNFFVGNRKTRVHFSKVIWKLINISSISVLGIRESREYEHDG